MTSEHRSDPSLAASQVVTSSLTIKALIRTWFEALITGHGVDDAATELFATDAIGHESHGDRNGRDAIVASFCARIGVLARRTINFDFVGECSTHVVLSYRIEGVQIGLIDGILPTGNLIWVDGISTYRHNGTCAIEYWDHWGLNESPMDAEVLAHNESNDTDVVRTHLIPAAHNLKVGDYANLTLWAQAWQLSPRQAQLGALLLLGATCKSAAAIMNLAEYTVRTYQRTLYAKAGASSQTQFMRRVIAVSTMTEPK